MARVVMLRHPQTGVIRKGFYGFSWTTLFFGGFPALFRGDILVGVLVFVLSFCTGWIGCIIWAFFYNKKYTLSLIEQGYCLADSPEVEMEARASLGIMSASRQS